MKPFVIHLKEGILLLILLLFISACRKEELIPSIVNELEFYCPEEKSVLFFEGEMGGREFCYYDGVEDYEFKYTTAIDFFTISPEITISPDSVSSSEPIQESRKWVGWGFWPKPIFVNSPVGGAPSLKPFLDIQSPASPISQNRSEITRKHIKKGPLILQSDKILSNQGFNISFEFIGPDSNIAQTFTARGGNQDGSYLRITDLDIRPLPDGQEQYDVTFAMECKLYYYGEPHRFYDILSGTMRAVFVVE